MKSIFSRRQATPLLQREKQAELMTAFDEHPGVNAELDCKEKAVGSAFTNDDQSPPDREAVDIDFNALVDACAHHSVIEAALASMQTLKVFVTNDGVVYHVEDPVRVRALEQLLELVRQELGRAIARPISLMTYSKLRSQAVRSHHESVSHNDLVEMVLHDAISRKSSDVYIAIHTDRTQIHFRTHGVRYLHSEISRTDGHEMARALWSLARSGQYEENGLFQTR